MAFPERGWFPSQRGVGASVLCGPCNHWCGTNLVPAYSALANDIVRTLSESLLEREGVVYVPGTVKLELPDYRLGAVARQALVMLLAASGGAALVRRWPVLREIVLGAQVPLPDGFVLGVSLVFGPRARLVPPSGVIGPGDKVAVFVEAAFMPFAWTLTIGGDRGAAEVVAVDVSEWLNHAIGEVVQATVELSAGTVQTAGPGDYRDSDQVFASIKERRGDRGATSC